MSAVSAWRTNAGGILGVLVCKSSRFQETRVRSFYRLLAIEGKKSGIKVIVFTPHTIHWNKMQITGWVFQLENETWVEQVHALPVLIYDRCFCMNPQIYKRYLFCMKKLRGLKHIRLLGSPLSGKWDVQRLLALEPSLLPHLPETEKYRGADTLIKWLNKYGELILKPQSGSQGKGVIHITQPDKFQLAITGRDVFNKPLEVHFDDVYAALPWIEQHCGSKKFLAQRYLTLTDSEGAPFDIRSLVQKDCMGKWQITGVAVRSGSKGGLTSNLHGGGSALPAMPFLTQQYGDQAAARILSNIMKLSATIPAVLESNHGRLVELGIDLGIDRNSRIWILEVNSKPGRSAFSQLDDAAVQQASVSNPVQYARHIWESQLGG